MKSEELITKLKNNEIPDGTKIKVEGYMSNLIISNYGCLRLEKEYWETLEGTKHPLSLYCVVDMLTNPNAEFEIVEECNTKKQDAIKLIDVLNMIVKGELKEGTKVICNNSTFEYRKLHKDSGRNTLDLYSKNNTSLINATYLTPVLSFEVELIEPPCEHEWLDWETHRMGEGRIRRYRRCNKCGLEEETEECVPDKRNTLEPSKIEEIQSPEIYGGITYHIIDKLNEVIRYISKEQ